MKMAEKLILFVSLALVVGVRLFHLTGPLDESSWRQSWCAYQARELSRESPPEIFHVKINYKGTNDVSVWNFPAYETVVAFSYKLIGGECLPLARLITLAFYSGAAIYLYLILLILLDKRTAIYTVVVYACLPLGVFYSRAVHYDASVLFFSNAFLYYALQFDRARKFRACFLAILMATLAFSVKAPYCMSMAAPLGIWILTGKEPHKIRRLAYAAGLFIIPFLAGWAFHLYRLHLEGHLTSSLLYPDPYTADYAKKWYFGSLSLRLDRARWLYFVRNLVWLVLTPVGFFAAAWAILTPAPGTSRRGWWAVWGWLAGATGYVLLVFPMVTSAHDYYLLPLLAPAAILIGKFLADLNQLESTPNSHWRTGVRLGLFMILFLASTGVALKKGPYFRHDWQRIEAGRVIREQTCPSDLIVSSAKGRSTGGPDPRLLYFADRRGWTISYANLNQSNLDTYRAANARYLALLLTRDFPPSNEQYPALASFPHQIYDLKGTGGEPIGWLVLFDLSVSPLSAIERK